MAGQFAAALKKGDFESGEKLWSEEIVSFEAMDGPMKELRGRAAHFESMQRRDSGRPRPSSVNRMQIERAKASRYRQPPDLSSTGKILTNVSTAWIYPS